MGKIKETVLKNKNVGSFLAIMELQNAYKWYKVVDSFYHKLKYYKPWVFAVNIG